MGQIFPWRRKKENRLISIVSKPIKVVVVVLQGLSERMAFLKLLVLGTESTIGAKICGKISIKGKHF